MDIKVTLPPEGCSLYKLINNIERQLVEQAYRNALGNKTRAAALLGIQRTTLTEKMRKLGLHVSPKDKVQAC
jgi:DNA-binding NtrC family response regulator